jgi:hypothetical protein
VTFRAKVVQAMLALFDAPRYLEVGVYEGSTFHDVEAAVKVGVDPDFQFERGASVPGVSLHEITSDAYFAEHADAGAPFDVIFLDGLHTFEQTLRDLTNALAFTHERSVILVDDVYPSSPVAAIGDYERFRAVRNALEIESWVWMGDVYHLVYFIETFMPQLSFAAPLPHLAPLVVWRERRTAVPERTVAEIAALRYEDIVLSGESYNPMGLDQIVARIRAISASP